MKKIVIFDIRYDIDEDAVKALDLPKSLVIDAADDISEDELKLFLAKEVSDYTQGKHNSFRYKEDKGETYCMVFQAPFSNDCLVQYPALSLEEALNRIWKYNGTGEGNFIRQGGTVTIQCIQTGKDIYSEKIRFAVDPDNLSFELYVMEKRQGILSFQMVAKIAEIVNEISPDGPVNLNALTSPAVRQETDLYVVYDTVTDSRQICLYDAILTEVSTNSLTFTDIFGYGIEETTVLSMTNWTVLKQIMALMKGIQKDLEAGILEKEVIGNKTYLRLKDNDRRV